MQHEATNYAWSSQVLPGYINPSSGLCFNVLVTAARSGDVMLATEVFRTLGQRSTIFTSAHYEELIHAYLGADTPDLRAALSAMTLMAGSNVELSLPSTRFLFTYLQENPEQVDEAFQMLVTLRESGRKVPVAVINTLIEAYADQGEFEQAFICYKSAHEFGPPEHPGNARDVYVTIDTFNNLLKGARDAREPVPLQTAMFLVSEMRALGVKPTSLTYDRILLVCLKSNDFDLAWQYYEEMEGLGWSPRSGTSIQLAKKLARVKDFRCWDVLQRVQSDKVLSMQVTFHIKNNWVESRQPDASDEEAEVVQSTQ